jgi:HK97 family phage major capsid protein
MNSKELREKRAVHAKGIMQLRDELHDGDDKAAELTPDQNSEWQEKWDRANEAYDAFTKQIEVAERAEEVQADQEAIIGNPRIGRGNVDSRETATAGAPTEEDRCLALQAWVRCANDFDIRDDHEAACKRLNFNPRQRRLNVPLMEQRYVEAAQKAYRSVHSSLAQERALSAITGGAGALTIPEGFITSLEDNLLHWGQIRQVATIMRTASGNDLPWPTSDDTGNTGAQIAESGAVTTSGADPTFGQIIFGAYKYESKGVKVPFELLEDSAFNLAPKIGEWLGSRLGRIQNTDGTTGDGAAKPAGLLTESSLGVTSAAAAAITADEIIDLIHSIDIAYRTQGATFMCHDEIVAYIRKLKDGNGQYLWQPGFQAGVPDRILSYPFVVNNDMTGTTSGVPVTATKHLMFGAMGKFQIREVNAIRLLRLDELYAANDQIGFFAFMRWDSHLLDAGTAPVKHLLQA